ncbi:MAG TPA: hypothetical protein VF819_10605 [Nitrospira sp.]
MATSKTYTISTTDGRQDRALGREYTTGDEAAEAIRRMMGWDEIYLSDSYAVDSGDAVSAYETQEACDADEEGAHAPRITAAVTAHGYTFSAWLRAAGRDSSTSDYDLRAAWRAGEEPSEYVS